MYPIQDLLYKGASVLHVGYGSKEMLSLFRGGYSTNRIWRTRSDNFRLKRLSIDEFVVSVIDPGEEGSYSSITACMGLKLCQTIPY